MKYKYLALAPLLVASNIIKNNNKLKVTNYDLAFETLPPSFDGFKIAQVSDIHCDKVGISDLFFIEKLKNFAPDIIVITGDMLDSYKNDMEIVHNILSQIATIAPCYFVSGNHELRLKKEYKELKKMLAKLHITNLNNEHISLTNGEEHINLAGVEDFNYYKEDDEVFYRENFEKKLAELYEKDSFNLLLSHRPEKISFYKKAKYDLVFSGHAHGGQWRVPFVGAIFSPSQGFFPKYTAGIYREDNTTLVVSCGLGNSSFPIRINNQIELVLTTLHKK